MPKIKLNEQQAKKQKILVVGAVAGGATFSARARRLSEAAEIIMFDRGPYVSFANCGLPYYIGGVIPEEDNLLLSSKKDFKNQFNVDVRLYSEVTSIDRENKEITVREVQTGREYKENYDKLVIASGSKPVKPNLPGIDMEGIYTLRNIPDANQIKQWIQAHDVKEAVVVGGGLIGMEMTENLTALGVKVTVVEMLSHVIPFFDEEMAVQAHAALEEKGVALSMNTTVKGFNRIEGSSHIEVKTDPDKNLTCDMVILSIGTRPENDLAREAGIELGSLGGVRVNGQMQTSDDDIYAVGDVVESRDIITGEWTLSLLAGPANRQARIAADSIFGINRSFRGVQATAVCRIFDTNIASTGVSEKTLDRCSNTGNVIPYSKVYLYPKNHADYYPGATMLMMKLLYSTEDGKVLGAQVIGNEGTEKRIDTIAMAIQMGATVFDLEEAELCYAPQFGSAKDPVNMAGMAAANILRGDVPTTQWENVDPDTMMIIDPRGPDDYNNGHVGNAVNIPWGTVRKSLDQLDKNTPVYVYCNQGKTSYYVSRILLLNGFDCTNIAGGYKTYQAWKQTKPA